MASNDRPGDDCALLIIGAGMAGLNALAVATRYLGATDKVMLVDRLPAGGGMWTNAYDYVRLHQPHPVFTAGDIPWNAGLPREHLAHKREVLTHIARCLAVLRAKVALDERYGWEYVAHREVQDAHGWLAEVDIRPCDGGAMQTVRARRCVKAIGFDVPINPPLAFASRQVVSVSPQDYAGFDAALTASDAPVYIVGGGKTAMDTAHHVLGRFPGRAVSIAVGRGTLFFEREKMFPPGVGRWWRGTLSAQFFTDIASRFDGDNADAVLEHFRRHYSISLDPSFRYYMLGLLSRAENDFIARGIRGYVKDYVDDVVDVDGVPAIAYRSGTRQAVAPGAIFVNCSGFIMRAPHAYEPYVSAHGAVVSVQSSSSIFIFTTFGAYFLTHLLFLGQLATLPLYEIDLEGLHQRDKAALPFAAITHDLYNLLLITGATPSHVMTECGLDFNRWYPLPRRLAFVVGLQRRRAALLDHCRRALDRLHARTGLRCGLLEHVAARHAEAGNGADVARTG